MSDRQSAERLIADPPVRAMSESTGDSFPADGQAPLWSAPARVPEIDVEGTRNNASLVYRVFLVAGDFFAVVGAFVGAYVLRVKLDPRPLVEAISARSYLAMFLALLPFWIIIFALLGLYSQNVYEKRISELGRLLMGSFLGLLFVIGCDFISKTTIFPARLVPVYGFVFAFLFEVLFRTLARAIRTVLFSYNIGITNVLIVGANPLTEELIATLSETRASGYRVVGVVANGKPVADTSVPIFREFADALLRLERTPVHSIFQTELHAEEARNQEILNYAQTHHIGYRFAPGNSDLFVGNIEVELFRSSVPVIAVHHTALFGWGRIVKRLFDLVVSGLILLVASPIMLVVGLLIFCGRNGSVFFRQTRLTLHHQRFRIYKFRTQYQKYDGTTPEEAFAMLGRPDLAEQYRDNGDYLLNDPRVTPFGRFLRKTSIDELPQLFNVVRGELSLIGPRALIPEELHEFEKHHAILSVKSGISGLAQVSGRRSISFEQRRQLDMYYVKNWSFWLDITILLKTIRVVLMGSGAQ